ncbi:DUF4124 domain-containing protein [Legionella yabuuchiae]|uniref:DUF4124 domain-containing protein n=1 Tax=Legionella yabuuchiae TaxID=376727 RepID=UPI001056C3C4|nr:DUF4124 domain-containing protein [Legionella yabuuchiae]
MKKIVLLAVLVLLSLPMQAQIYKWTDSSGTVHFTDKPRPGAEKVDLPAVQTFSSPPIEQASTPEPPQLGDEVKNYKIEIVEPQNQATIRNNQGYISVMLQVTPELKEDDKVQILFDGSPLGEPQANTVFALQDVNRGSHSIAAQLVGADGKVIKTSETITVFMHRPRVGMVPQTRPAGRAP